MDDCGMLSAKATLDFLVLVRAAWSTSSMGGGIGPGVDFLGAIMGLVFRAQMVGAKCWFRQVGPNTRE